MHTSLSNLARLRTGLRTCRHSSWNPTGANNDFWLIPVGKTVTLGEMQGPGCVKHLWMTTDEADFTLEAWPSRRTDCTFGGACGYGGGCHLALLRLHRALRLATRPAAARGGAGVACAHALRRSLMPLKTQDAVRWLRRSRVSCLDFGTRGGRIA